MAAFSPPQPKVPKILPRTPTMNEAVLLEEERARLRERRGAAASLLTGEKGIPSPLGGGGSPLGR